MTNSNNIRIIPRLDIKGQNLIKGVHLEGLKVIGSPQEYATKYYEQGADELIYVDSVASLYGRNHLSEIIQRACENIFIPLTVGGGIRSVTDVRNVLRIGADKVAINTAAVNKPELISQIANEFGSQCLVLYIEAKKISFNSWEVFTDNGRESSGKDVVNWIKQAIKLGIGEILLTSIDKEGTKKGFDYDLIKAVTSFSTVPVIANGGMGNLKDGVEAIKNFGADAISMSSILHYEINKLSQIRESLLSEGLNARKFS